MTTLNVLVVVHTLDAEVVQLAHHLARMARVNSIVTSGCCKQDGRVLGFQADIVIRRVLLNKTPVRLWITVLSDPRGSREQLMISSHVEQRYLEPGVR